MKANAIKFHPSIENPSEWDARYFTGSWSISNTLFDVGERIVQLGLWDSDLTSACKTAKATIDRLRRETFESWE